MAIMYSMIVGNKTIVLHRKSVVAERLWETVVRQKQVGIATMQIRQIVDLHVCHRQYDALQ